MGSTLESDAVVVRANAASVAHCPLPPIPSALTGDPEVDGVGTLVLFYQYVEPAWTKKQHKAAMNFVVKLAAEHGVCGRGRCAAEGLNCTLVSGK